MIETAADKTQTGRQERVRFAPSPTGDLHVGGVRTALFNYLYARHTDGKFLLRIEDTDRKRSTPEAIRVILDGLAWLELEPDETPVYQSQRIDNHVAAAQQLLIEGHAYRCFCEPEEIEARRKESQEYKYDRFCLNLSPEDIENKLDQGLSFAVRLKVPDEDVKFTDNIHGEITVSGSEIDDFILLRRDGTPTYMLAVVVDDIDMDVTTIIRGDDHLSNTPKQILLYHVLNRPLPEFAHVPMILGPDRKRLSKRHGATSITWYRDAGYLQETMINFLGLLGWSPGDDRDIISRQELIDLFDIGGIQSKSAVFNEAKARWLNGQYLGRMEYNDVADELDAFARAALVEGTIEDVPSSSEIRAAWYLLRNRIHFLKDLFEDCRYMFRDPDTYDEKGVRKHFMKGGVIDRLNRLADDFAGLDPFNKETTEHLIRILDEELDVSAGKLIHPVRLACSGVTGGPGIFDMLEALGRETVVRRLRRAADWISEI